MSGPVDPTYDAESDAEPFSPALDCYWRGIRVLGEGEVELLLGHGSCTDMTGAIGIVLALMPGCWRIVTTAAEGPDVTYYRHGDMWEAVDPDGAGWGRCGPFAAFERRRQPIQK